MRPSTAALAIAILALAATATGRAEPTIEIRARAVLELHGSRADDGRVHVRAILTDDVGAPIRAATVAVAPRSRGTTCAAAGRCTTDRDGSCEVSLDDCSADEVSGRYEGGETTDGADVVAPIVDHGAEPRVRVRVDGGQDVDLDARSVRVAVAIEDIASVPARVTLADELGRVILHRSLAAGAPSTFDVQPRELGPPGLGSIVATVRFEDSSEASGRVMIARRTRTRLVLSRDGEDVVARLTDGFGPVAGVIVGLTVDDAAALDLRTDERGRARFTLEPSESLRVARAAFHSNDSARTDAVSNPIRLPRAPRPYLKLALPFVSLALLAVLVVRRATRERETTVAPVAKDEPKTVEIAEAHALLPTHSDLGLRVLAREDSRPIAARVRIEGTSLRHETDAAGRVRFDRLDGAVHVVVEADGRAPESIRVRAPHRGEWSDAIVRLETARAFARRAIPIVARAAASSEDEGEVLTVREADERLAPTADVEFREDAEAAIYGTDEPSVERALGLVERSRKRAGTARGS